MKIRRARYEDALFVYALSQEPSVKAASVRSGETFSLDHHLAWWDGRFMSIAQSWWIGEVNERPVGYVRYGRCGAGECAHRRLGNSAEVSIAVHPQFRHQGLARALLARTRGPARRALLVRTLFALVRPENTPSNVLFYGAGYLWEDDEDRLGVRLRRLVSVR